MSRLEIEAAACALRRAAGRRMRSEAFESRSADAVASPLVAACAAEVRSDPTYRGALVARLHARIVAGTYARSADAIAEQIVGRLVAAEIR